MIFHNGVPTFADVQKSIGGKLRLYPRMNRRRIGKGLQHIQFCNFFCEEVQKFDALEYFRMYRKKQFFFARDDIFADIVQLCFKFT